MMDNQVLLDKKLKELEFYYDILKETAKSKFNLKVVEKKMLLPINVDRQYIYLNSKQSLEYKAHFLNGLLMELTVNDIFGKKSDKQFNLHDMNYVNDHISNRYAGDELENDVPTHKENADKVLINLDFVYKEAKEKLLSQLN